MERFGEDILSRMGQNLFHLLALRQVEPFVRIHPEDEVASRMRQAEVPGIREAAVPGKRMNDAPYERHMSTVRSVEPVSTKTISFTLSRQRVIQASSSFTIMHRDSFGSDTRLHSFVTPILRPIRSNSGS